MLKDLTTRMVGAVDTMRGGLRGAPKFPQWSFFWLLWRGGIRFDLPASRAAVETTLANICQGGIYDHLGGGFARYSVDDRWLVPHFEKMLYDNALLVDLMTEVWRETRNPLFKVRVEETVGWLQREMIADGGGFAASLDADSEGEEGKFYVWTAAEIAEVLGAEDARLFALVYDVTPDGNWEGHTILNRLSNLALGSEAEEDKLAGLRAKLLARRADAHPAGLGRQGARRLERLDDRRARARRIACSTGANGSDAAERAFAFVETSMTVDGRLMHAARAGQLQGARDRQRLRQHDLGRAAPARGDQQRRLSRRPPNAGRHPGSPLLVEGQGGLSHLGRRHARCHRAPALGARRCRSQRQRHHVSATSLASSADRQGPTT